MRKTCMERWLYKQCSSTLFPVVPLRSDVSEAVKLNEVRRLERCG